MARCPAMAVALLVLAGPFMQAGRAQAPAPSPSTGGGLAVTGSVTGSAGRGSRKATFDTAASTPMRIHVGGCTHSGCQAGLQLERRWSPP